MVLIKVLIFFCFILEPGTLIKKKIIWKEKRKSYGDVKEEQRGAAGPTTQ